MSVIHFIDNRGTFLCQDADEDKNLYFPIANEEGLKSVVTPSLAGDSKLDQNTFLLEPASIEDLHDSEATRNFWLDLGEEGIWSACGQSANQESQIFCEDKDRTTVMGGFLWHHMSRESKKLGVRAHVLSYVPEGTTTELI